MGKGVETGRYEDPNSVPTGTPGEIAILEDLSIKTQRTTGHNRPR
jgi:hypothetical protein